ncbi:Holliday junction ATP-dependent DNA helicase RuvA [uncultured Ruminococcus sp.]|uniref:Holliday junction branch migration complex subunit RuvA n=1 Tax=Massiliimalia timonensis TaxID=1987501 RepID=A0A8J6P523_9FIRM|nr:Holliday junction branch migration protein RuvA [Massiliimalia timonensis]MBC8609794.1 Holliday junction branch migration protein RuvA [Massiliimalia timonensis]MBS7175018.1 Holliday junction branch migration protein RuvA [Clostridiales bacterium]SCH25183.1 Holliday junction ATP-dependent DNA helicase RuvA [uncultured Ruminococcus sp.]SCH29823.1 Holliday junction ATP-dependent DNA helicase RuvA [uncultured Clostridium sp.]
MIYSLHGILKVTEPNFVVVDVGGVGYGVKTTLTTVSTLPPVGEEVFLYTYLHVREDAMELYGFYDASELNCYKMLISVNGVGPKAALSILSDHTPEQFALCVASGDAKALTKSAGIGLKTAQRIVLELKDKVSKEQVADGVTGRRAAPAAVATGNAAEAISALVVLGYPQSEAAAVISSLDPSTSVEDMIKAGLKGLASNL